MFLVCQPVRSPGLSESGSLERARKNRGRLANTPCLFTARHQEPDDIDLAPAVHEDDEPEEYFAPTTAGEGIQFWPWVNKVWVLLIIQQSHLT